MKKIYLLSIVIFLFVFLAINSSFSEPEINIYDSADNYKAETVNNQNILIILDCSYSMDDKIDGQRKIDIAKTVINNVLEELPKNINVGLRVYGHQDGFLFFDGCKATELLVPVASGTQNIITEKMKKLDAVGWTPICYSFEQAINNDFSGMDGKKRIILVSDGMETCGGDPCQFAVDLMKKRTDITIDVIGFNIESDPEAVSQLKCVALATYGKFYTANNASQFTDSLKRSLNVQEKVQGKIFVK
jgi:Ca-activated chloride channel family protein